jgi:hypothetical protein
MREKEEREGGGSFPAHRASSPKVGGVRLTE